MNKKLQGGMHLVVSLRANHCDGATIRTMDVIIPNANMCMENETDGCAFVEC